MPGPRPPRHTTHRSATDDITPSASVRIQKAAVEPDRRTDRLRSRRAANSSVISLPNSARKLRGYARSRTRKSPT